MYKIIGISKLVFQRKEVLFLGFIERSERCALSKKIWCDFRNLRGPISPIELGGNLSWIRYGNWDLKIRKKSACTWAALDK